MIAICNDSTTPSTDWQTGFMALLPEIESRICQACRYRGQSAREDYLADAVVLCLWSYKRLHARGRARLVSASSLAWFATKQLRVGRGDACRLNANDILSRYARLRRGFRVERLDEIEQHEKEWVNAIVMDWRSTVLDQVAARLDITAWLATLCKRTRQIAADLGQGGLTSEVARKFGVSAGRISQLRRELAESWATFQHEPATLSSMAKRRCPSPCFGFFDSNPIDVERATAGHSR